MRRAIQWLGVAAVGTVFEVACSSSDYRSSSPSKITIISASNTAGADSSEPNATAGAANGGATSGNGGASTVLAGAGGEAGADNIAGAGAGGAAACEGEYECPSVLYWSHTTINVDLPVSVADTADAVFTACRNSECYSAKGSATVPGIPDFLEPDVEDGWVHTQEGADIYLKFHSSGATSFAVLDWQFSYGGLAPNVTSEHYSLTIEPSGGVVTTLFDGEVNYTVVQADPSLVSEGFCVHCSEVSQATVDARIAR